MPKTKEENKKRMLIEGIMEGRKMDAYAEHRTREMHACWLCGAVSYKRKPVKNIGMRWICIDCLRQLKESLDTLKQWEEELSLEKDMKRQLEDSLESE